MGKIFTAAFLVLIAFVPLAQLAFGPAPALHAGNLREFERRLDEDSIFVQRARPAIQSLTFALREAGEKVLARNDGTLFYRQDVRYLTEPADTREAFETILDTHRQLEKRGIRLAVMPIPVKPHASGTRSPAMDLLPRLRSAGIETIDLFAQPRQYLKLDTHWTPATARAMARFAAPLLGIERGTAQFSEREVRVERRGDLAQMLAIRSRFAPEPVTAWQVEGPVSDPATPLLVLGDSFLRIFQADPPRNAGFIAHLAKELRLPVASIVNDGGASTLVRQDLARRSQLLAGKKVVLWEFVERDLRFGAEGWRRVTLP